MVQYKNLAYTKPPPNFTRREIVYHDKYLCYPEIVYHDKYLCYPEIVYHDKYCLFRFIITFIKATT